MQAAGKNVYWPPVGIVAGIGDELIIDGNPRRSGQRVTVIGFDNAFDAGMRQLPITDQDAGAAGVEIGLMYAGNAVDDAADADGVVRPAPLLAIDGYAAGRGAVGIGEVPGLDGAISPAAARKHAERLGDLLLQIDADAGAAVVVVAHQPGIGRHAGGLRERDSVGK